MPLIDIISAKAIVTLGVPEPNVIKKSGILFPFTFVLCNRYAITQEIKIPKNAAAVAARKLFVVELIIEALEKTFSHAFNDKFDKVSGFPMFTVNDVIATVINGKIITKNEKIEIIIVIGNLHFPNSTIFGLVDLPLIVIYCFLPTTNVEIYKIILDINIKNTARVIASVSPSSEPI